MRRNRVPAWTGIGYRHAPESRTGMGRITHPAYRRLLDIDYLSEKPLSLEVEAVARKIRLDLDIPESVLAEFFERTDEEYRNQRGYIEIARYRHKVERNRALGKRGGRPKKTEP